MTKAELRGQFRAKRKSLLEVDVQHRSQLITQRFFDFIEENKPSIKPGILHTFLPIQQQHEVDTWPIIHQLWTTFRHIQVAVPVVDIKQNALSHYLISSDTPLTENRWGIPEPDPTSLQSRQSAEFTIVLVPLLIFDQQGNRVGYGGGYYDRFLAECQPDCLKIGLSLFEPVNRIDDVESTDVRLNSCLTPDRTWLF